MTKQSRKFFELFIQVRKELCASSPLESYQLEEAIRKTFDRWKQQTEELKAKPTEQKENEVYGRKECVYVYCPTAMLCKTSDHCCLYGNKEEVKL